MLLPVAEPKRASPALPDQTEATNHGITLRLTLTTRLAIAMIALVGIAVLAVGYFGYRSVEQAVLPRVLDRIETHSRFVAADLESRVRAAPADVTTFANLAAVAGLMRARLNSGIDPTDGTTEAVWRERQEGRLAAQMRLKPAYSLRFIGLADDHREIVRVDHSGPSDTVRIVPEAELRQVGDAPYFRDAINLAQIRSTSRRPAPTKKTA